MKVLYISAATPYNKVGHAGGQTLNYYISRMAEEPDMDVSLVSYCTEDIARQVSEEKKNIHFYPIIRKKGMKNTVGNAFSIVSKFYPLHKYGNIMMSYAASLLRNKLKELKKNGYSPDVIVMEWTQIVLQVKDIRRIFPASAIIASEHDVTFLGSQRKAGAEQRRIKKHYYSIQAGNMFKREMAALQQCDLVFTHNLKDCKLLAEAGLPACKRDSLVAYYHQSKEIRNRKNNDIIFYGNMKRKENYQAALWFIDSVMPKLSELPVRFVVVGGNPPEELTEKANEKIVVTGFVDTIDPYFSEAMCFVAPLFLGAGIKVKVLEALYTCIPVLTNKIGIEGINAERDVDYYYCETAEDYADTIQKLYNQILPSVTNGKQFIEDNFSLESSYVNYLNRIKNMKDR